MKHKILEKQQNYVLKNLNKLLNEWHEGVLKAAVNGKIGEY